MEQTPSKKLPNSTRGNIIRSVRSGGVAVEQNVFDMSVAFNTTPQEQKNKYVIRYFNEENYIAVGAPPQSELIRTEDLVLLVSCFLLYKHTKTRIDKYTIEVNYSQIAALLGLKKSGENYKQIKAGLKRLVSNFVETNFWFDTVKSERVVKSEFHFLEKVDKGKSESVRIRFNPDIIRSMEEGYLKVLEEKSLMKILRLRGYASVLALFLLKKIGTDKEKNLTMEFILEILGIKQKYLQYSLRDRNRNIKKNIIPALEKAANSIGYKITVVQPTAGLFQQEIQIYPSTEKFKHYDLLKTKVIFKKLSPGELAALEQKEKTVRKKIPPQNPSGRDKISEQVKRMPLKEKRRILEQLALRSDREKFQKFIESLDQIQDLSSEDLKLVLATVDKYVEFYLRMQNKPT